jgi:general secretion pathway protein G
MRKAFTMIELVMVIVILGILSSVAISKMAVTRDDAILTKGRSQVASIRSAISLLKSKNMMSGTGKIYPDRLDALPNPNNASNDGDKLFDYDTNDGNASRKLLDYPIYSKDANGNWRKTAKNKYVFKALKTDITFIYTPSNGSFDCNHTSSDAKVKKYCKALAE